MHKYKTCAGDTFDLISFKELGSEKFMKEIINANRSYVDTLIFRAGVELIIPDVVKEETVNLPPWKKSS